MRTWERSSYVVAIIGLVGLVGLVIGLWLQSFFCFAGGAVAVCAAVLSFRLKQRGETEARQRVRPRQECRRDDDPPAERLKPLTRSHPNDTESLVEEMLAAGRFALLLRPQILGNLHGDQLRRAKDELDKTMSLVPTGPVLLGPPEEDLDEQEADWKGNTVRPVAGRLIHVESYFLDQHPVTNAEYRRFVDDGGYEQLAIWDESALPAMLDFVDKTGEPGPRFWAGGSYPEGEEDSPVVGVSWYEALAYARWAGKRLPSDAEWVKAGAWPVESSPGCLTQRRYPWGNSYDAARANVWGSGPGKPVAVDRYKGGISVGGSCQLIGNVWEWTASNFGDPDDTTLRLSTPMKSIRGGAFDTYFESQATCHFQSGDSLLARKHNIGFRLAIGACDLAPEATGLLDSSPGLPAAADAEDVGQGAVPDVSPDTELGVVLGRVPAAPGHSGANGSLITTSVEEAV